MTNQDRRQLLRSFFVWIPALPALAYVSTLASKANAQTPPPSAGPGKLVSADDPLAKALKYVADASKAVRTKRGETEGDKQFCSNCALYQPAGQVSGITAGKCLAIPTGLVSEKGWCQSWAQRPKS